jgi:hypothetical protein
MSIAPLAPKAITEGASEAIMTETFCSIARFGKNTLP